jgi:hypothetical protein
LPQVLRRSATPSSDGKVLLGSSFGCLYTCPEICSSNNCGVARMFESRGQLRPYAPSHLAECPPELAECPPELAATELPPYVCGYSERALKAVEMSRRSPKWICRVARHSRALANRVEILELVGSTRSMPLPLFGWSTCVATYRARAQRSGRGPRERARRPRKHTHPACAGSACPRYRRVLFAKLSPEQARALCLGCRTRDLGEIQSIHRSSLRDGRPV